MEKNYKDIKMQPELPLHEGQNRFYVLSIGVTKNGTALVTIFQNGESECYRLPTEYSEWAMTVVGMDNMGE